MIIAGEWRVCDDGATRPVVPIKVAAADGAYHVEFFLVDTCADRTVFSADLLSKLRFFGVPATGGALQGIGGVTGIALVKTVLEFTRADGGAAHVRGQFAAFTDPAATDLSILGRVVLDNFDVIVSRPRDEILLLAPNHRYRLEHV